MEKSFPFNADIVNGAPDRLYSADDWAAERACYIGNGILTENSLCVGADSGMRVKVASGAACINGRTYMNTDWVVLSVGASSATLPRIDLIVVRLDFQARSMALAVVEGTPATTPAAPAPASTETVTELPIASVFVGVDATVITDADITDLRVMATYPIDHEAIARRYMDSLADMLGFDGITAVRALADAVTLDGSGNKALCDDGQYHLRRVRVELARWTVPGTYTINLASHPSADGLYDVELLGGGGAGGTDNGGGGGAGGYLCARELPLPPGVYTVTVGAGGTNINLVERSPAGATTFGSPAFGVLTAGGGGMGGNASSADGYNAAGGAGGAAGYYTGASGGVGTRANGGGSGASSPYGTGGAGAITAALRTADPAYGDAIGYGAGGGGRTEAGGVTAGSGSGGLAILYGYATA